MESSLARRKPALPRRRFVNATTIIIHTRLYFDFDCTWRRRWRTRSTQCEINSYSRHFVVSLGKTLYDIFLCLAVLASSFKFSSFHSIKGKKQTEATLKLTGISWHFLKQKLDQSLDSRPLFNVSDVVLLKLVSTTSERG